MGKKLSGKVIILTGASAGLGKQMAPYLSSLGAKLTICARRTEKLMETAKICEEAGGEVLALTCDVSKYDDLKNLVDETITHFGKLDVLINNANKEAIYVPFIEQDIQELDDALHVGVYAHWNLMKLCFPYLKASKGAIINFTSGVYQVGFAMMAAYVADKAAIRGLSMVAAREWGPAGIRVNTISPVAMTDTIMENLPPGFKKIVLKEAKKNCLHKLGDPVRDINPVIAFLCSDDSQWITGQNINVDGGTVVSI